LPFSKFKKEVRDLVRLEQIIGVFAKYGFGYLVEKLHLPMPVSGRGPAEDLFHIPLEVRFRKVLEELGPTFIKLGQMLSLRPEIIPYSFCRELEKLQDKVPPIEFEKVQEVIEQEFKKPLHKIFKDFPKESLASASLAQVYKVKLKNKEAIVKVQKPGVEAIVESDLEILGFLASLAEEHISEAARYSPKSILEEFKTFILKEMNFNNEARHIERFRRNFRGSQTVHFPRVYKELSTKRVIVMERVKGAKINDVEKIKKAGLDTKKIARCLADCVLKQIFIDGFFHADPHPGNIFVLKDGRICFLDFGIVGVMDEAKKLKLADILIAGIEKDSERILEIFGELGALGHASERDLKVALDEMLDKYYGISVEEFDMDAFFKDVVRIISENKVKLLPDYFLLVKTLAMIESAGRPLDPDFNVTAQIKAFTEKLIKEQYSPGRIARRLKKFGKNTIDFMQSFPQDLYAIVNKVKRGDLKLGFVHTNLENLISMLDRISSRISFSLIISALIIGSSIIINTDQETFFGRSHQVGVLGFVVAGILGIWLLVNILRSGHL